MSPTTSSSDVILAWSLQTALWAGLAVSSVGLAVSFRRPAMKVLAVFFALFWLASTLLWGSLAAGSYGMPQREASMIAALVLPLSPLLTGILAWHLIRLLAGRTERAFPPAALMASVGIGGLIASLTISWLVQTTTPGSASTIGVIGVIGALSAIAVATSLAWYAFRLRRRTDEHRYALALMGVAFIALATRSAINVAVAVVGMLNDQLPNFGLMATVMQVFLVVVIGVCLIIAVLDEERASIVKRTEQIGLVEVALARSQRLESVGRMSGAVAHDFNNLLAVIGMSAESARVAPRDEATTDFDMILASTKRGQELTKQLLAFARQAPQEVTRFDVSYQINRLDGLLQRLVGKERSLSISVAPTPQLVEMDATQLEQVLINLVVNARDASARDGRIEVVVTSTAAPSHPDAAFVRFSVTDYGSGIPPEVLPSIFEPFFSTKTVGEGTGLGLATCDGIVRRSGGRIEVTTEVGKGTRFDVFLPRARTSKA